MSHHCLTAGYVRADLDAGNGSHPLAARRSIRRFGFRTSIGLRDADNAEIHGVALNTIRRGRRL
jgi:hypothetical protein